MELQECAALVSTIAAAVSVASAAISYHSSGNWKRQLKRQAADKCLVSARKFEGAAHRYIEHLSKNEQNDKLGRDCDAMWDAYRELTADITVVRNYVPTLRYSRSLEFLSIEIKGLPDHKVGRLDHTDGARIAEAKKSISDCMGEIISKLSG